MGKIIIICLLISLVPLYLLFQQQSLSLIKPLYQVINQTPNQSFIPQLPTLDQIFSDDHNWVKQLPAGKIRTILVTGDIIPARSVNFQATTRKDFTWPYLQTADILKQADLTFINLETPLIDNCPLTQEGMIFCGDSRNIGGLVFSGIDLVNLANNHAGNYGKMAVEETKTLLNSRGILVTGIDGSEIIDVKGLKIAFLGYNDINKPQPGLSNVDEEKIKSDILKARKKADVVIVAFHWGQEYQAQPDERQKYLGHLAIDSGADLVIGNHPHWIQPVEIYQNKLITYAHGNFIFDQQWSLKTRQGVVGKYTFYDKQLIDVEFLPVLIENYGQPHFLEGKEKQAILEEMRLQSEKLANNKSS